MNVDEIVGRNVALDNPVLHYAALRVTGDAPSDTAGIDIEGLIQGSPNDPGRGLQVETCQQCSFKFALNNSFDYNVVVGTDPIGNACTGSMIGPPGLIYDENGGETGATTCIDPNNTTGLLFYPQRARLLPPAPP